MEGLVHRRYVRLDTDLRLGDGITCLLSVDLRRTVTLSDARISTTVCCRLVSIHLLKVWAYRVCIEGLHGKLVRDRRRIDLASIRRRYCLRWQ